MKPPVVLLHGLARTERSMRRLGKRLEEAGYPTWARSYPSRDLPIDELAALVGDWIEADLGRGPLLAVGHSLGGILLRLLSERFAWKGVVMLAPPNQGSAVAARLAAWSLFKRVYGPAGQDVGNGSRWPPPPRPVGVIAGTRGPSLGNPPSWLVTMLGLGPPAPHDGTVGVAETRLDAMDAFAEVDASHTWIMNHPETLRLILRFFEHGRFE